MPITKKTNTMSQNGRNINVRMPNSLDDEFTRLLKPLGHNRGSAIRILIQDWVKEQRDSNKE